jgi:O-antigen ligase
MKNTLERISLGLIFLGVGITLFIPLITNSNFLFPFIFPKALVFRVVVSLIFLFYSFLVYLNREYLPKLNIIFWLIFSFVIISFISSLFGVDFYLSFWGDIERSEGLILWLHLLTYFIVVSGVLKDEKIWLIYFDISLFSSLLLSLFALAQIFKIESVLNTTGVRISSTIGNPAFLAAYLIFQLAFCAYLFIKRPNLLKIYYVILFLFFSYIIIETQTRGAAVGLAAAFLVSGGLFLLTTKNKLVKIISLILISVVIVSSLTIYLGRNTDFIRSNSTFSRLAAISLNDPTVKTRLVAWKAAWSGWQNDFIFGYGLENFNKVFDKNFPPSIYEDEGSRVWFDRAHNFIFDRGVTTGIAGLILYLAFILSPSILFVKNIFRRRNEGDEINSSDYYLNIIFIGFTIGFLIQNLFIFETITTYIILFFCWAFLASKIDLFKLKLEIGGKIRMSFLVLFLIFSVPIIWFVDVKPALANLKIAKAMHLYHALDDPNVKYTFFDVTDEFKKGLNLKTYGLPEYRINFIEFMYFRLTSIGPVSDEVKPELSFADGVINDQIEQRPNDAKNYLLAMRFYNSTFSSLPGQEIDRLDTALGFLYKLVELSPTRPHVYQEAGFSELYKFRFYKQNGDLELAEKSSDHAENYFKKAKDLNPKVVESYINLIMLYLNLEQTQEIQAVVDEMDKNVVAFRNLSYLNRLISLSVGNKNFEWATRFAEEYIKINPNDLGVWNNLAVTYAYLGQEQKAIETAEKMKTIFSNITGLEQDVDLFISEIKSGKYGQNNL